MCGIAGMAGIADERRLRAMLAITRHRGPDDSGTYVAEGHTSAGRVAIGSNRLSILDLSPAGHQPMCNEDRTIWVAYNGEIFNHIELRAELLALHRSLGATMIYVTHDQTEAMTIGQRIGVLHEGRLRQVGTPATRHPLSG